MNIQKIEGSCDKCLMLVIDIITERIAHSNALRLHRCTITGCGKVTFDIYSYLLSYKLANFNTIILFNCKYLKLIFIEL